MDKSNFQHCFVDWHVHFYPSYDYPSAIKRVFIKLKSYCQQLDLEAGAVAILVLTERDDCSFYSDLSIDCSHLEDQFKITKLKLGILISEADNHLIIFPGRQINTKERVELLSLGSDERIPSGQDLDSTIEQITNNLSFPVVNWAPGKWWMARGRLIKALILKSSSSLYLCDTSLRPKYYPRPVLMRLADSKGIPVINGSDPLPPPEEQDLIFSYITYYQQSFDLSDPSTSLKNLIQSKPTKILGERSSIFQLYLRLKRYYRNKI